MTHAHQHATVVAGSTGSLGLGIFAQVAQVPGSTWLTFLGIMGAVLAPVAVQVLRWAEGREALVAQLDDLHRRVAENAVTLLELRCVAARSDANVADLESLVRDVEITGSALPLVRALRSVQARSRENSEAIALLERERLDRDRGKL